MGGPGKENDSSYDLALLRAFSVARERVGLLTKEHSDAPALLQELLQHPEARQITLVRNSKRFQTWALCELLLEGSFDCRFDRPRKGLEFAMVALEMADGLEPELYGVAPIKDLKARAWAYAGNSQRIISEFRDAEFSFREAFRCLRNGTGDPLERALCLRLHAQVALDKREIEVSVRRFDAALAIYERFGDAFLAAQVLLSKAKARAVGGDGEGSIGLLRAALRVFVDLEEPRFVALTRQNLARSLSDQGEHEEALAELAAIEGDFEELGGLIAARLEWSKARVLREMGRRVEAEQILLETRGRFVDEGFAYDAALVSLDLAMVYAGQGRSSEMRQLAQDMLPIFQSRDVHREAMAALIIFCQAAEAERATLGLVQEVAAFLEKAQNNRKLRFRPSS